MIQRPSFGGNWGRSGMGRMFLRLKGGPLGKGDPGTESQGTYDNDQYSVHDLRIKFGFYLLEL